MGAGDSKPRPGQYTELPGSSHGARSQSEGDDVDTPSMTRQPKPSGSSMPSNGFTDIDGPDEMFKDFKFEYENLVLEGGGAQGNAYIGAILELHRLGYLSKIHRFAGASIGAFTACLLAIGHGPDTFVDEILHGTQISDLLDAPCGGCSFVPNVYRFLGWHPGREIEQFIGKFIAMKFDGNENATFKDLWNLSEKENKRLGLKGEDRMKRRELCVMVTNVSTMSEEYCHVKTTPDMKLKDAVRMSTSIPGVFFPKWSRNVVGLSDVYVDGGLLCNYPVHCYDGWWLSMKEEDCFLEKMVDKETETFEDIAKRLTTKKERFGSVNNEKTFGMIIYCDYDSHVLPTKPELVAPVANLPNTQLAQSYRELKDKRKIDTEKQERVRNAMVAFMRALKANNRGDSRNITLDEFKHVFKKGSEFTAEHARELFGEDISHKKIFDLIDANHDNKITFRELLVFTEKKGVNLLAQHIGLGRQDIQGAGDFAIGLFQTLLRNVKKAFLEGNDIERTVLINTVYYKSFDFESEDGDLEFLVEQGRRGVRQFLKYQYDVQQEAKRQHERSS